MLGKKNMVLYRVAFGFIILARLCDVMLPSECNSE
jgi:hypothetical protein